MTISRRLIAITLACIAVIATPAFAQHRSSGGRSVHASGGRVYAGTRSVYGGHRGGVVVVSHGGGYGYYAPARFYRPYYSFRPHFSLGFGFWLGYPVAYSAPY